MARAPRKIQAVALTPRMKSAALKSRPAAIRLLIMSAYKKRTQTDRIPISMSPTLDFARATQFNPFHTAPKTAFKMWDLACTDAAIRRFSTENQHF
jgi:hypothetical protein